MRPEDPPRQEIREQLARILLSSDFRAESLRRFLRFVVEESLAGRASEIKAYTVAVRAFERPTSFDPQTDPIVRVQARRLRRALRYYYGTEGAQDPIVIAIPRGTYVPVFRRNELSEEGAFDTALETVLSEAAPRAEVPGGPSILVLPFDTLRDDVEQVYLASGLAEATTVALSRHPEFRVLGPLSRERLKASSRGRQALARACGARFLLDGHFRKEGDRMRLSVRLIDVPSRSTLWAETFDSGDQILDAFAFEDAVTSHIAVVLGDTYGVIHRTLTSHAVEKRLDSIQVYDAILRYYHFSAEFPEESRAATLEALESAVAMDPLNPVTLALLADMHLVEYQLGGDDVTLGRAEKLINQALASDPNCQHARYANLGLHFVRGQRDLLLDESRRAIMLNPNRLDIVAMCGLYLALAGEWERGIEMMEEAKRKSPHLPSTYRIGPFMNLYRQGQYREALTEALRIHAPDFFWDPLLRAAALGQLGRTDEAEAAFRELLRLEPSFSEQGRELMRRMVFSDENVDMLLQGLRQAGFEQER